MPNMNHTGPEGKGPRSGRGLGRCKKPAPESPKESPFELGQGMGFKRKAGGGRGKGRRLKEGKQ
jgi:hypothetical protein